jgi:sensor histidine kinase regulating citrate/malate metabolism
MIASKKIFLILAFFVTVFVQNSFAQDSTKTQPAQILNAYYKLKNALVSSNATSAAANANELVNAINATDKQIINDDARAALLKDANAVSQSKDIKLQREKFATLSNNMFELAKTVKLSNEPFYQQYCPMKKASWLSNDKAIKNPYYGSAMLTCGNVKTIL